MSYGFFKEEDIKSVPAATSGRPHSCISCGLYKGARSPKIKPFGNFKLGILNIGEAPGESEDRRGRPWQGKVGNRLKRELAQFGIDLFDDCLNVNSANCRPPKNRAPTDYEIACCRTKIVNPAIEKYEPHTIILLGGSAISSVIGARWHKDLGAVSKWRGWTIPDQNLKAWICPVFHPSYVEREQDREEIQTIWRQDLKRAIETADRKLPAYSDLMDKFVLLKDEADIVSTIKRITRGEEGDIAAFDYETTGAKPQAEGHEIICTSIATKAQAYAFMGPRSPEVKKAWCRFLKTPKIDKVAHNMKYEDIWSSVILGTTVNNWTWDSILAAHILDNRPGTKSLKFQVYINFGIAGYDSAIEYYLKSKDPKNSNSLNRIYEALDKLGEDKVLEYNALDSLFTLKLALKQMYQISR